MHKPNLFYILLYTKTYLMKKNIIGALVGAIILFLWQFVSWTAANLHRSANAYTPKQDSILAYLNNQSLEDGDYYLPALPPTASSADEMEAMKSNVGKPWVKISYHKSMKDNMISNMIRLLLVNVLLLWLVCWILSKIYHPSSGTIFLSTLFIGLVVFMNGPYTYHIWYDTKDITAYLIDAVASWGLTGLWLGWWLRRK